MIFSSLSHLLDINTLILSLSLSLSVCMSVYMYAHIYIYQKMKNLCSSAVIVVEVQVYGTHANCVVDSTDYVWDCFEAYA